LDLQAYEKVLVILEKLMINKNIKEVNNKDNKNRK